MLFAVSACANKIPSKEKHSTFASTKVDVNIRWTSYGIPHVKANDWKSLGYGYAYATATDGICVIAKDLLVVKGELETHFGKDQRPSDLFHRAIITKQLLNEFTKAQSPRALAFSAGYVAGYNRYLKDHAGRLPASCNKAAWLKPIDTDDMTRLLVGVGIRYGLGQYSNHIVAARPPSDEQDLTNLQSNTKTLPINTEPLASNAIAFGRDVTDNGRGILFGNPHYPWSGSSRFHLIHMTIPGKLDVMGTSLLSTAGVSIGFNHDVAWSHTVSTGTRATLYKLTLHPEDPTMYKFGRSYRKMDAKTIELDTANGKESATVYFSHYGPIVSRDDIPWNANHAYAVRDANLLNFQAAETYDALSKARDVQEITNALTIGGVSWVNTIAADKSGNALYADISSVPNVDAELLSNCQVGSVRVGRRVMVVLDGSRNECAWKETHEAAVPGTMPASEMPRLVRGDYVSNSNDSHWLSNPEAPLEGYSPIIGLERTARSFRTRAGLRFIEELLGAGPVKADDLTSLISSHRNFAAEQLLDDLLTLCTPENPNISKSCNVLASWDRTHKIDSKGAHLWTEIMRTLIAKKDIYRVPFDVNKPAHTPTGLKVSDQKTRKILVDAVLNAEKILAKARIPLDATLGDIQYAMRNGRKIPIPGGEGWSGAFSMIVTKLSETPGVGYSPIIHGNSIIEFISWDNNGKVIPKGILTYSQSQEPDSPHYSDQTELYSRGEWIDFPFHEADIVKDPNLRELKLTE